MWYKVEGQSFDGGRVINAEEGGGAGITLEKGSFFAPYTITFGIYGLGFHTATYNTYEIAMTKYESMKQDYECFIEELERNCKGDIQAEADGICEWFSSFVDKYPDWVSQNDVVEDEEDETESDEVIRCNYAIKSSDGSIYQGDVTRKMEPDGHGICTWSNGDKYEGAWKDGYSHGFGLMIYANGEKYEGEWKSGEKEGQGTFTLVDGEKFEGSWINDHPVGRGRVIKTDGLIRPGEWKKDEDGDEGDKVFVFDD